MNLLEIKNRLDSLNKYYEFLSTTPDNISAIDKDTFLMKLRELYDLVLFDSAKKIEETIVDTIPEKEEPKVEEAKNTKKTAQFVYTQTETTKKVEEKPKTVIEKVKETTPPVVEKKEEPKKEPEVVVEIAKEEPKKEPEAVVETAKEEPKDNKVSTEGDFNEDFEELFVYKQATDLAAKLSESPISNLSQVLGLNEKFYYINELFGGDAAKFNQAIDYLNTIGDFDKARLYMEQNFVEQLGWIKKEKKNLAKDFIKLVRRRYL